MAPDAGKDPITADPTLSAVLLSWSFDPPVVLGLLVFSTLYARGVLRLSRRGGFARHIGAGRFAAMALAITTLVIALLSPIAVFGGFFLTVHMAQHLLLTQVAAPLLLLGRPVPTLLLGVPTSIGRYVAPLVARSGPLYAFGSRVTEPRVAFVVFHVILLGWHAGPLYSLATVNTTVHYAQHLTFFGGAVLFWWAAVDPISGRNIRRRYFALLTQALAFLVANGLGIYISFAEGILYAPYAEAPRLWNISAQDDQLLAGLVMWIAGSAVYLVSMLATLAAANAQDESARRRAEARETALAP